MAEEHISSILIVFGFFIIIGNTLGGKLSDKNLKRALYVTLISSVASYFFLFAVGNSPFFTVIAVAFMRLATFSAAPCFQINVMSRAENAPTLASTLNISAFNLGNAIGAGAGGWIVYAMTGRYDLLPLIAAVFALIAIGLASWNNYLSSTDR